MNNVTYLLTTNIFHVIIILYPIEGTDKNHTRPLQTELYRGLGRPADHIRNGNRRGNAEKTVHQFGAGAPLGNK